MSGKNPNGDLQPGSGVRKSLSYAQRKNKFLSGHNISPLDVGSSPHTYTTPAAAAAATPAAAAAAPSTPAPPPAINRSAPGQLNIDALQYAAPSRVAANMRQEGMEGEMEHAFMGPVGDGNSMNEANYDPNAPEAFGYNSAWDERNAHRVKPGGSEAGGPAAGKGGSRKRTKKYTNKRKRKPKRQTRRKNLRKRK